LQKWSFKYATDSQIFKTIFREEFPLIFFARLAGKKYVAITNLHSAISQFFLRQSVNLWQKKPSFLCNNLKFEISYTLSRALASSLTNTIFALP